MDEYKKYGGYLVYRDGRVKGIRSGIFLKPHCDSCGDLCVYLYEGKKFRHYKIKKLVVGAFIGFEGGNKVRHRDGDRENNHVDNLEVLDIRSKLSWDDVREIRVSKETGALLAKKYGVTPTTISQIRLGHTWKVE